MDGDQGRQPPDGIDAHGRQFVSELRRLKDRSGLSLTALAARTHASRSSWDRYLNGRGLPPAAALRQFARACAGDADRLLALRSLAEEERRTAAGRAEPASAEASAEEPPYKGRPAEEPPSEGRPSKGASQPGSPPPEQGRTSPEAPAASSRPARRSVPAVVLAGMAAAVATTTALLLWAVGSDAASDAGSDAGRRPPQADKSRRVEPSAFVFEPGRTYTCDIHRAGGRLYAGRSDTVQALLQQVSTSWEVVEAQCLLRYRGYLPGEIDGAYGPSTEKAVKRLQDNAGLVPDGIMGPHTWEVLRK
ncbi:peptidoglycan-binding protein [Streptomyces sp. MUM 178J]|uniref:peptidoglycan-binding protein n=1 Tax=Streptomyces sp. MUM 178J TaxID=2791991 RepID=UPI001F04F617|nr:peptidoglycan-binding protein [Streptomyces sp. MUM 178J]WRQ82253.1 peptidoglycan-binding protein [Streptomyces sp. MUM 178J]